jgi:NAD(P)-dependent dehydrogenase (short-subunit alcohol dehydrogenase family)
VIGWKGVKVPPVKHRTILITGCSSGIGLATAIHLRDRGWRVVPTARKERDLARLEDEGFEAVPLDLAESSSVGSAADRTLDQLNGSIGAVVNNAGYGQVGAVEDVSREALRRQFEVNVFGLQELTNRFIPLFREQGWGRIINVSSVYGRITAPLVGSYCASKHALEALSDALRMELRGSGVAVSLIEPGAIVTDFRRNAAEQAERSLDLDAARFGERYSRAVERGKEGRKKPGRFGLPPEAVARKICRALESRRPRARYCVTIPAHLVAFLRRVLPTAFIDSALARSLPK